jgi:hypothetical protein
MMRPARFDPSDRSWEVAADPKGKRAVHRLPVGEPAQMANVAPQTAHVSRGRRSLEKWGACGRATWPRPLRAVPCREQFGAFQLGPSPTTAAFDGPTAATRPVVIPAVHGVLGLASIVWSSEPPPMLWNFKGQLL